MPREATRLTTVYLDLSVELTSNAIMYLAIIAVVSKRTKRNSLRFFDLRELGKEGTKSLGCYMRNLASQVIDFGNSTILLIILQRFVEARFCLIILALFQQELS